MEGKMKSKTIVIILVVLCVIGFLFTIADFLALHDIRHEYVSTGILNHLGITLSGELPEWTATQGEWEVVRISYLFRAIFFIFAVYAIYWLLFKGKTTKG